jgi:alkyl hydroperoxide reductase subunit AhpC
LSEKIGVIEQTIKQIDLRTTTLESRSETHSSNIADLQTKYTYQDLEIEALKDQNASIERQLNTLQKQNKSLQDQAVVQVTQNKILHDKFLYQENYSRRMNRIFHGFKESAWETETQSEAIVRNYMHDTLKVDSTTFKFDYPPRGSSDPE